MQNFYTCTETYDLPSRCLNATVHTCTHLNATMFVLNCCPNAGTINNLQYMTALSASVRDDRQTAECSKRFCASNVWEGCPTTFEFQRADFNFQLNFSQEFAHSPKKVV